LRVTTPGAGQGTVTSAPAGIDCGPTCRASMPAGIAVTLTAAPAEHSEFAGWSGGGCSGTGSCEVTLEGDASVAATFRHLHHTVSVSVVGGGRVRASTGRILACREGAGTCQGAYPEGTALTLTAMPDAQHAFAGWSGCDSVDGSTCNLDVGSDEHPTASFTAK
ncbi:MAG TPA: hypothetical protein VHV53_01135, partial [Solirubrobacterales bacterium]|nr:hypothetical protein [Solirubrobacterales bacterium]